MRNILGSAVSLTLFGESHGAAIGGVLDGLPSGIKINTAYINKLLALRSGEEEISTKRREKDNIEFLSGVYKGFTNGAPLCFILKNEDVSSVNYRKNAFVMRPSHADYPAFIRNGEYGDNRGGGHFSGRLTAVITAAGGILLPLLKQKGIEIATHIGSIGEISDRDFLNFQKDFKLCLKPFAVLDKKAGEEMRRLIIKTADSLDSIGGTLKTAILGVPIGVGEPFFDTVEGVIGKAVFSIPAIKGIEFGGGFSLGFKTAGETNDRMYFEDEKVCFKSNNQGGVSGGLSNGQPIIFKTAVKPTPTISAEQTTVNLKTKQTQRVKYGGRHDPSIVPRAAIVQTSAAALAVADLCAIRFGTDWLRG